MVSNPFSTSHYSPLFRCKNGFKELGFNELIFSGDLQMSFVDNTIQIHQWGSGIVTFNSNFEIIDSFFYNKEIQNVNNARIDQERNIWITTIDNGLYYLPATKRQIITEPIGNYKEYTYPFSYYKYKNVLYTGTNYSGIFGNSRAILLPNEKLPRHIIDIIQLKDKLIFGGVNFSFILDQKVRDLREYKATIKSSSPNLKLNNLGTGGIFNNAKAICKLDENSFFYSNRYSTFKATFNTSNEIDVWEISPNKSYAMVYEKGKGLWMGAERGLYFWDEKKDSIYRVLCDEVDFTINKLEIRNGILWIGSNGLGLWALNIKNRSIKRVPRLKGMKI